MSDATLRLKRWFAELRRRKVVRVGVVYVVVAWILIQVAGETFGPLGLPDWSTKLVIVLAALGLPLALALAWAFDLGPRGIERTSAARRGGFGTRRACTGGNHAAAGSRLTGTARGDRRAGTIAIRRHSPVSGHERGTRPGLLLRRYR
jgi:hypothetical protein